MDETRVTVILVMGGLAYAARVLPQVLFIGNKFPEVWDRFLRYLSYSFICGIISNTLFVTGARFDTFGLAARRLFSHWLSISAGIEVESHRDRHSHLVIRQRRRPVPPRRRTGNAGRD